MTETFDVLVAGGGILGLSTAWNLSQRGVRVALVEQKHPGYGSTGRCIGKGIFSAVTRTEGTQPSGRGMVDEPCDFIGWEKNTILRP